MHPFAVPLALSDLDGDANVALKRGQGGAGARPACEVRGPRVLNVCQLWERGPVALAFFAIRSGRCVDQLDTLERLRRAYPDIEFAAVAIKGDRDDLRRMIRGHGWRFPVGYDRDGALANLYGVAVCPHITYAAFTIAATPRSPTRDPSSKGSTRATAAITASTRAGWPGAG